jgi:hypothetical protein
MAWTTPPTWNSGDTLAASDLQIVSDDLSYLKAVADGTTFLGTRVTRAAATSIPDSTSTAITFTAENYDYGSWWASGTDIIVPAAAIPSGFTTIAVSITVRVVFASNGTGQRRASIKVNGSAIVNPSVGAVSGDTTEISFSIPWPVAAADVITMEVYQNSGGALNASSMACTVYRIAPAA